MQIYIYIQTNIQVCKYTHSHIYINTYVHICIYKYMYTYVHRSYNGGVQAMVSVATLCSEIRCRSFSAPSTDVELYGFRV